MGRAEDPQAPQAAVSRRFVPGDHTAQASQVPERSLANKILVPSGDQPNSRSSDGCLTTEVSWLPSADITKMSFWPEPFLYGVVIGDVLPVRRETHRFAQAVVDTL